MAALHRIRSCTIWSYLQPQLLWTNTQTRQGKLRALTLARHVVMYPRQRAFEPQGRRPSPVHSIPISQTPWNHMGFCPWSGNTIRVTPSKCKKGRGLGWPDFRDSENETHCSSGKKKTFRLLGKWRVCSHAWSWLVFPFGVSGPEQHLQ